MAKPNSSPHGVGDIIVTINEAFENKFGKKLVIEDSGDLVGGGGRGLELNQTEKVDVSSTVSGSLGMVSDGFSLIITDYDSNLLEKYYMSEEYNLSSVSYTGDSFDVSGQEAEPIEPVTDGETMIILFTGDYNLHQYSFGQLWDVTTLSYDNISYDFLPDVGNARGMVSNGETLIIGDTNNNELVEYEMSQQWDLSSISLTGNTVSSSSPQSLTTDGDILLIGDGQDIDQYLFGSPWDITTLNGPVASTRAPPGSDGLVSGNDRFIAYNDSNVDVLEYRYTKKLQFPEG